MKGIIALDIDGTITADHHAIEAAVADFLRRLHEEGWRIIFITGRTFNWGYAVLRHLDFPYYFAVQNGSILLEMPARKILHTKYLDRSIFPVMEQICAGEPTDFVIYSGFEYDDRCFYRPDRFDDDLKAYIRRRLSHHREEWIPLKSFEELPVKEFSSIKCFGRAESAHRIASNIESRLGLHAPIIRDPFAEDILIIQATLPGVDKGAALKDLEEYLGHPKQVIAAGDDNNDRPMLAQAHVKVVMATAPSDMIALADVVAPPASEAGIIKGLTAAIALLENSP